MSPAKAAAMRLRDRPAYHLARLMGARGGGSPLTLARRVWPDLGADKARQRVRNMLAGHWPRPEVVEALAAEYGLDVSSFFAIDVPDLDVCGGPPLIERPSRWLARRLGNKWRAGDGIVWLDPESVEMLAAAAGVDAGVFYSRPERGAGS